MTAIPWEQLVAGAPGGAEGSAGAAADRRVNGVRVPAKDVADITAQLAIMTKSGVDIATAMQSLAAQCARPALAEVLETVRDDVIGGKRFSEALAFHPRVFDEAYVATVAAGEATGQMAEIFGQLAELKRSELRLRRTIATLLVYPTLLATVSVLVVAALVVFVLPQFAGIFEQYDTPLPAVTKVLLAVAEELQSRWWLWAPIAAGLVAAAVSLRVTPAGRRVWDHALLHGPGIGPVSQKLIVGRLCRLMGLMIGSGVTLLDALGLARKSTTNSLYQALVSDLENAVTNGHSLTSTLQTSEIFPAAATEMIGTAERSGKLGEVLRMVGAYFEEEGEAGARSITAALEPLITVVMGAVVAVVVLAVMLPVFDLATVARGGH